jgi:hypothetical protein
MSLRASNWKFDSWGSGSMSFHFFSATGGDLHLKDPAGNVIKFGYFGAGLGVGPPMPSWFKGFGGNVAPKDFASRAYRDRVLLLPGFPGTDLMRDDICGECLILDLGYSLGAVGGRTVCAMVLGGGSGKLPKAVIAMEGENLGLGGGASACVGFLSVKDDPVREPNGLWEVTADDTWTYYYRFRSGGVVQWFYDRFNAEKRYWHFDDGKGRWNTDRKSKLEIKWNSLDTESWPIPFLSTVTGQWRTKGGELHQMKARRLM